MNGDSGSHHREMSGNAPMARRKRGPAASHPRRRWVVVVLLCVFTVTAALVGGLGVFALKVATGRPQADATADGIVVLTGGPARISEGLKLLSTRKAKRLLITGVNMSTSREALRNQLGAEKALFDCCVDLGREAVNTEGNAAEAAAWLRDQAFNSVILVTSNYHMPRSLVEFRRYLPDATVIAYPVAAGSPISESATTMLTDTAAFRLLCVEYAKYLVALARMVAWDSWRVSLPPAPS